MLLWVNVHGGFVMGFVLLGIYLASNAIRYFQRRQDEMRRTTSASVVQIRGW